MKTNDIDVSSCDPAGKKIAVQLVIIFEGRITAIVVPAI